MKLAKIMENDIVDCDGGICVSVWFQGCPHRCKGCHNPETWNFEGEDTDNKKAVEKIKDLIIKNDIKRNLSVLGGEPLAPQNIKDAIYLLKEIKKTYPEIKTYLWTGYTIEEINKFDNKDFLNYVDVLIEGRFIEEQRDISLKLRGSKNQRILYKENNFQG